MNESPTGKFIIERRLVIPGLIIGIITVMALTVMGMQYLPFYTRAEANSRFAETDLRLVTDEARITKLEDRYDDIQTQLSQLDVNVGKILQQLQDQQTMTMTPRNR